MAKSKSSLKLIIVESPHKASVIQKFLGSQYKAVASAGHIRDLPKKGRGKKALGIETDNGYAMHYEIIKGKEKKVEELKAAVAKAGEVYLAPDPDREGEAIAWHLQEALGLKPKEAKRVTYTAVTKKAVLEAMEKPREIDMNLVNAQQARRALDRLVGFNLSPFLWKKVAKSLSAGRVQSPAVRMIVEREREITAFKSEEYWSIEAQILPQGKDKAFNAQLASWGGKKFGLGSPFAASKESAEEVLAKIKASACRLLSVETKETKSKPNPPFITSTLQQAANIYLHFSATRTMRIAQRLYEGVDMEGGAAGLITYMRTDSVNVDPSAIQEARNCIESRLGSQYVPAKPNIYSSGKNAQEAHEAIRPVSPALEPEQAKAYLTPEEFKLYDLIWRRFMQSQMPPALYASTSVKIEADKGLLEARGRVPLFDGFLALAKDKEKEGGEPENQLPPLKPEDAIAIAEAEALQHFTKPPARYNEASLVKALEKEGIGRPSTYAPIIQTIMERGYVIQKNRAFWATELGMAVNDMLADRFKEIVDLKFTAGMENDLDKVENGQENWIELLDRFYKPFAQEVEQAMQEAEPLKGKPWSGPERCPVCGAELVVRYSKNGAFLGCSRYPECKGLMPMPGQTGDGEEEEGLQAEPVGCSVCGKPMVLKKSRYGQPFYACSGYPECKNTASADKEGKLVELPKIEALCNKCGKPMAVKMSRRGPFLACTGYPDCKNTMALGKDGQIEEAPEIDNPGVCEKCGKPMAVRRGPRGWFLGCTGYPRCRNAKPLPGEEKEEKPKSPKKSKKQP